LGRYGKAARPPKQGIFRESATLLWMPPEETRSDEELVAAANDGDHSALAGIYLKHRDWVYSLALRFTGDRELAADVAQEAFIYLYRKFPGLVLRARLTTLLYPAVKNTALAMKRKRKPESAGDAIDCHTAPETRTAPQGVALAGAVASLPDGQREVLLMRVVDEMAVAEIAAALGIPEGPVKSRLHHAIRAVRSAIQIPEDEL
jgi:RNA polymerase sigma-70 factor, ECF subfamily